MDDRTKHFPNRDEENWDYYERRISKVLEKVSAVFDFYL